MRVGLNATCFNDRPSGANQRFLNIYGALMRDRPDIEFILYEPVDQRIASWFKDLKNVSARQTPLPSIGRLARVRAGAGYWQRQLRRDRLDLFESFHLPLVVAPDCPTLLTIHDLRPIRPDRPWLSRSTARIVLRHALTQADRIIAVSNAVREELQTFLPVARVSTVYNGVDAVGFVAPPSAFVDEVRARYGLPDSYVLTVGHLELRKNLSLLVDAIALLRDRGRPLSLVIVGNDGGTRAALLAHIARCGLPKLVTVIEGADDSTVRALYASCALLALSSRYEGFGIPIIEAMAANRPMALADTAVFRELTQGQSQYFPVDDAIAAADAIERVWSDSAERKRQQAFGSRRVVDFAFNELASQIAAIYETLV